MIKNLFLVALLSISSLSAFAGTDELDQDNANQALQGTVVLRVDQRTGEMSMIQTDQVVENAAEAQKLSEGEFTTVPAEKIKSELDREAGASSWYWYNPGYSYGYGYNYGYYSYGNCYNPWYSYSYGYYSYYYYNRYSYYW
jgi:hypothetical protein